MWPIRSYKGLKSELGLSQLSTEKKALSKDMQTSEFKESKKCFKRNYYSAIYQIALNWKAQIKLGKFNLRFCQWENKVVVFLWF